MFHLILKRLLWMIPTLFAISFISFALIQLPPGDYLTSYVTALAGVLPFKAEGQQIIQPLEILDHKGAVEVVAAA